MGLTRVPFLSLLTTELWSSSLLPSEKTKSWTYFLHLVLKLPAIQAHKWWCIILHLVCKLSSGTNSGTAVPLQIPREIERSTNDGTVFSRDEHFHMFTVKEQSCFNLSVVGNTLSSGKCQSLLNTGIKEHKHFPVSYFVFDISGPLKKPTADSRLVNHDKISQIK